MDLDHGQPLRVAHVITGLERGGAETMLYRLLGALADQPVAACVISLTGPGTLAEPIEQLGVPVHCLRLNTPCGLAGGLPRLCRLLRDWPADVVQGWLYHGNLAASLAVGRHGPPVVWGIHHTGTEGLRGRTRGLVALSARLSRSAAASIVCCSNSALVTHRQLGFATERLTTIANGWDTQAWRPRPELRAAARTALDLAPDDLVVGTVGRFHAMKDYPTLVAAIGQLAQRWSTLKLLLCGRGLTPDNVELTGWLRELELLDRVRLVGERTDIPAVLSSLDVFCLSSHTEALPLVVGEAMASGLPCIQTDVGDLRALAGSTGWVVPPRNPDALAATLATVLALPADQRQAAGQAGRTRIQRRHSLQVMARRYLDLWRSVQA